MDARVPPSLGSTDRWPSVLTVSRDPLAAADPIGIDPDDFGFGSTREGCRFSVEDGPPLEEAEEEWAPSDDSSRGPKGKLRNCRDEGGHTTELATRMSGSLRLVRFASNTSPKFKKSRVPDPPP